MEELTFLERRSVLERNTHQVVAACFCIFPALS
jgi:hypothetical protein